VADRNMMLTMDEYLAIRQLIESERESEGAKVAASTPTPKRKTNRKANRALSAALKEANRRLRTKSGALRKGKTQKDVMVLAQRLRKKM
jgi:hypothetical protein